MSPTYKDLDMDTEATLCERFRAGDESAMVVLVTAHEPYLRTIANRYARQYGVSAEDLMQECRLGLVIAARKFKRNRRVRFLTYAQWWARHCAGRACQDQAGAYRIPVHMQTSGRAQPKRAVSLSNPAYQEGTETLCDILPAGGVAVDEQAANNEEATWLRSVVDRVLRRMPPRTQAVVRARLMSYHDDPGFKTLEELGNQFGITREAIRQIEAKAKRKIADAVQAARARREETVI